MNEDLKKNVTKENELLEQLTNDYNALIVTIPPHLREKKNLQKEDEDLNNTTLPKR